MAGIFANVDSDINKLRQLKAEIENIKKALKSINVKVDIDIAKGMEAQLKSLMGQYDALVKKVSEAEGKIMLSTKRINDASEKIIKAQEQLSKSAGVNPQSGSGNANTAANNAETASVQAQAKAYDELAAEIDAVMGTRMQNIKRLIEEQNAIRLINEEIKKLTKYQSGSSLLSLSQQKRLEQLNNSLLTHKAALSEIRQTLMNNAKLDNAAATSMNGLSQSLSRMRIAYRELTEEERNSPFGKELLASINQADAKIKALDATIGNHQRNVGNYASGWNGLNMSVQQIVRELPAAAMGLNMFFLAISNNLPILTDEIKRAKARNAELIAQNQKATPVWKQLVSSLFSWQSAMMVGITLLTVYGKDIWNWVSSLFGANEAQKRLNESVKDFASVLGESQTQARLLFDAVKQTEEGTKGRAQAIEQINSSYGKYLPSLLTEKASLMEIKRAYEEVNRAMLENAAAKAKANAIDKVMDDTLSKQAEALEQITKVVSRTYGDKRASSVVQDIVKWTDRYIRMGNSQKNLFSMFAFQEKNNELPVGLLKYINNYISAAYDANEEIEKIQFKYDPFFNKEKADEAIVQNKEYWSKQREIYIKELESLSDEEAKGQKGWSLKLKISNIDKRIDSSYSLFNKEQSKNEGSRQQQQKLFDDLLQLRFQNQQDEINLMADGAEKRRKQIELDYRKEYAEIRKLEKEWTNQYGGKLTQEQTIEISRRYTNADKKYASEMFGIDTESIDSEEAKYQKLLSEYQDYLTKRKEAENKYNADRKILEERGASQEQIDELEYQRNEALEAIDNEFAMREDTFQAWMDDIANFSIERLKEALVQAEQELAEVEQSGVGGQGLAVARAKVNTARRELSTKEAKKSLSPDKRSKKEWMDLYNTLQKVNKQFEEIGDTVGGVAGEIISTAGSISASTLQMVDGIVTIANSSSEAISETGEVTEKTLSTAEKASLILTVITAALQIATKIASLFTKQSTYEKYEETKEVYESYISLLDKVIEKHLELAESLSGMNANAAYDKAIETLKLQEEAARTLGKQYLDSREKREHTKGYKEVEEMSAEGWAQAANAMGISVSAFQGMMGGRMTGLFDLSAEQLKKLQEEAPLFIANLDSETQDYINAIIEGGEKLDEVWERQKENFTGISFDSLKDNFISALSDMKSSSKDFTDDFEEMMRDAIIRSFVNSEEFQKKLRKWHDSFSAAMSDGKLSEDEKEQLQKDYNELVDWGINYRDSAFEAMGFNPSSSGQQSASSRGFETMSQDAADELNGRFTAVYESNLRIEMATQQQTMAITELKGPITAFNETSKGIYNIADETRTILANSYLELQQIRENTGEIVKPIKQIQTDIAEVRRNTAGLVS